MKNISIHKHSKFPLLVVYLVEKSGSMYLRSLATILQSSNAAQYCEAGESLQSSRYTIGMKVLKKIKMLNVNTDDINENGNYSNNDNNKYPVSYYFRPSARYYSLRMVRLKSRYKCISL